MPKLFLGEDLNSEIPADWNVQGMVTLTLPSEDKSVRPNVIMTKEYLSKQVDLVTYFGRIRESIQKRGIKDLKISEEKDVAIGGVRGKMMVCSWDVAAMAEMMKQKAPDKPAPNIPKGQIVKQIQVTFMNGNEVVNLTASFPSDKFNDYYTPFQEFLKSLKFGAKKEKTEK